VALKSELQKQYYSDVVFLKRFQQVFAAVLLNVWEMDENGDKIGDPVYECKTPNSRNVVKVLALVVEEETGKLQR